MLKLLSAIQRCWWVLKKKRKKSVIFLIHSYFNTIKFMNKKKSISWWSAPDTAFGNWISPEGYFRVIWLEIILKSDTITIFFSCIFFLLFHRFVKSILHECNVRFHIKCQVNFSLPMIWRSDVRTRAYFPMQSKFALSKLTN